MPTSRSDRRRRSAVALIAVLVLSIVPAVQVAADSTAQPLPLTQRWTDSSLITAADDWSHVPGIVGHLGQNITTTINGADPQTLLTDSVEPNDVDVIANLLEGNISNGGVGEFDGLDFAPDPVVALQASNVADAPYLLVNLDTTGRIAVDVRYVLRDIDATMDNAVQQVALQYRVGGSGTWTNIPAGYVADATTGPEEATLTTPVHAVLPSAANDQSLVQVRIITSNASGNDEWVGIDDINVTGTAPDDAPTVTSTTPGNGAADVARTANLSVTFSEPVDVAAGWFAISCATSSNHTAVVTGGPQAFSIDPDTDFANGESCTFTILAQNVADQDANDPPDLMAADHVSTFHTVAGTAKPPTVDAGGPYTVIEGGTVVVKASASSPDGQPLTYRWDLDGNGTFETAGQSATFSAVGLEAPHKRTIFAQVTGPTGLTAVDKAKVKAIWDFDGFRGLKSRSAPNKTNLGTLTLTFSLGGDQGMRIFQRGYPATYPCGARQPTRASKPVSIQGANGIRYDARRDEYTLKVNVDKGWKGTCRVLVLGLADGTKYTVAFRFKDAATAPRRR